MGRRKHKVDFYWDEERGMCRCTIFDMDNKYTGFAFCHPTDIDMKSQKVGEEIAYTRALINALKAKKKELKLELRGLLGYYYAIQHTSKFNRKSYEARMLYRQIRMRQDDIDSIDKEIDAREVYIYHYVDEKDKFYRIIRQNRAKAEPIENE
jgi:hypothetical protein